MARLQLIRETPKGEIPTEIAGLIDGIESELRMLGLWNFSEPDAALLQSDLPFCADTLSFEQWLQWVFVPRMRATMRNHEPLPTVSAIAPMAEECLAHLGSCVDSLVLLIERFDLRIRARARGLN